MVPNPPKLLTVLGWSPRVTGYLRSVELPCGCVVGIYETFEKARLSVIDIVASGCADVRHRPHVIVDLG